MTSTDQPVTSGWTGDLAQVLAQLRAASDGAETDQNGGLELDAFVQAELEDERARREKIDTRATGLITTSSALATLVFAAAALVTGQDGYVPPRLALWALALTFIAFAVAALFGLLAARSEPTEVVTTDQLLEWRNDDEKIWLNTQDNVRWLLVRAKIRSLDSLRIGNNAKMTRAKVGAVAQLAALAALVIAVGAILAKAIWPDLAGWMEMFLPPS